MPTQKAIEKIDAFMHQGGTVLFDTHDQMSAGMDLKGAATPNTQRLRDILDGLNIPALEQTPPDHVLSLSIKSRHYMRKTYPPMIKPWLNPPVKPVLPMLSPVIVRLMIPARLDLNRSTNS